MRRARGWVDKIALDRTIRVQPHCIKARARPHRLHTYAGPHLGFISDPDLDQSVHRRGTQELALRLQRDTG